MKNIQLYKNKWWYFFNRKLVNWIFITSNYSVIISILVWTLESSQGRSWNLFEDSSFEDLSISGWCMQTLIFDLILNFIFHLSCITFQISYEHILIMNTKLSKFLTNICFMYLPDISWWQSLAVYVFLIISSDVPRCSNAFIIRYFYVDIFSYCLEDPQGSLQRS